MRGPAGDVQVYGRYLGPSGGSWGLQKTSGCAMEVFVGPSVPLDVPVGFLGGSTGNTEAYRSIWGHVGWSIRNTEGCRGCLGFVGDIVGYREA